MEKDGEAEQMQGTVLESGIILRARRSKDGALRDPDFTDAGEASPSESTSLAKRRTIKLKVSSESLREFERSYGGILDSKRRSDGETPRASKPLSLNSSIIPCQTGNKLSFPNAMTSEQQYSHVSRPIYKQSSRSEPVEVCNSVPSCLPLLVHKPMPLSLDLKDAIVQSKEMHTRFSLPDPAPGDTPLLAFRKMSAPADPCLTELRIASPDFVEFEGTGQSKLRGVASQKTQSIQPVEKLHETSRPFPHSTPMLDMRVRHSTQPSRTIASNGKVQQVGNATAGTTCGSFSRAFAPPLNINSKDPFRNVSGQGTTSISRAMRPTEAFGKERSMSGHWQNIVSSETNPASSNLALVVAGKHQAVSNDAIVHMDKINPGASICKKLPVVSYDQLHRKILEEKSRHSVVTTGHTMRDGWLPITFDGKPIFIRKEEISEEQLERQVDTASKYHGETDCPGDDTETPSEFKQRLMYLLGQMMFVSGEMAEPSAETTWMIEEVVREQVVEMLKEATALANRRGSKSISIVDLIFQIRHNTAKVSRLKTFLSWKDVRKNVKDSDDKGGGDADAIDLEDSANLPGANTSSNQKSSTNKKAKLTLPWEVQSYFSETVPEREDEEDEEEEEQNDATIARLAAADERTKNMTREEYVFWSECRQASFTFRKGKRFREWAGFGTVIDSKPNDDIVDILGFLTFEIVQTITEEALKVKAIEDAANKKANSGRGDAETSKKRKREGCSLFEIPEEGRTPVEPKHVREAFRRLQAVPNKYKYMRHGYAGMRTPLKLI